LECAAEAKRRRRFLECGDWSPLLKALTSQRTPKRRLLAKMDPETQILGEHAAAKARGIRTVAMFEASKGLVVLLVGLGLLHFIHRDLQSAAEELVRLSHLNPARHYPHIFIEAARNVSDARLWFMASMAFAYSTARLVEAWGLWHLKKWAQWFAIISGGIYVPIEIFEIVRRVTVLRVAVLTVNVFIVAYLIYIRWSSRSSAVEPEPESTT
jgi:uncharacterized membrane protein (DUF2068 family)